MYLDACGEGPAAIVADVQDVALCALALDARVLNVSYPRQTWNLMPCSTSSFSTTYAGHLGRCLSQLSMPSVWAE
jgi:hypothetical protein